MTSGKWLVCKQTTLFGFIPWSKYLILSPPAVTPLGTMNVRGWTSWQSQATKFNTPGEAANNIVRRVGRRGTKSLEYEYVTSKYVSIYDSDGD